MIPLKLIVRELFYDLQIVFILFVNKLKFILYYFLFCIRMENLPKEVDILLTENL